MSKQYSHNPFLTEPDESKPICQHEGCLHEAIPCYPPEFKGGHRSLDRKSHVEFFCGDHAPDYGYCCACGCFWSGVLSFDLNRSGLCEYCEADIG